MLSKLLPPALLAASAIRCHAQSAHTPESKADNTPVTQADLAAHAAARDYLLAHDPETPLISEESDLPNDQERANLKRFWLLDPLDGTTEFVRGNPEYGVSLALIETRKVQAGVILAPALGEIAWGIVGIGAFYATLDPVELDDLDAASANILAHKLSQEASPVQMNHRQPPFVGSKAFPLRVLCSRSHTDTDTDLLIDSLAGVTRITVGACIKFIRLAQGLADYYPRLRKLHEWDIAGGHGIIKAAGANLYLFGTQEELEYGCPDFVSACFEAY